MAQPTAKNAHIEIKKSTIYKERERESSLALLHCLVKCLLPHPNDNEVEQAIHSSALELRLARVLHQLRVDAGEDDEAVAPLRVPQHAATQQNLIVVQGETLILPDEGALEFVQQVVGSLADDFAIEIPQEIVLIRQLGCLDQALLGLQVRFAIQLRCLNEAQTIRLRCGQQ